MLCRRPLQDEADLGSLLGVALLMMLMMIMMMMTIMMMIMMIMTCDHLITALCNVCQCTISFGVQVRFIGDLCLRRHRCSLVHHLNAAVSLTCKRVLWAA
uniref:Uncharacterized protein n=1 Tax=Pinguiococcus pyrenoidosus TaxID=172671 RepID=A0A7R9Y8K7_9STRA|mmetsp:Transcript_12792/g.47259  ORF Transcript_12792/g.47259 Transcript_12792/m.47259 type:complete len:100 (+) Transcript_12792:263-562(+)